MNQEIFYYLNNLAGKSVFFDNTIIFFGQYLAYILVVVFLLIVAKNKNWKMLVIAAVSTFFSRIIITEIIRFFYYVPRPFLISGVHQLIFNETSGSFPSGHAAFFFALAMAIYLFSQGPSSGRSRGRSFSAIFFAGAILIGLARIIAGIHWPLDIFAGAIIGILSALIICKIGQIFYNKT